MPLHYLVHLARMVHRIKPFSHPCEATLCLGLEFVTKSLQGFYA